MTRNTQRLLSASKAFLLGVVVGVGLAGCSPQAALEYPVRTSPLVLDTNVVPERPTPEPPGQLPLLRAEDVQDPANPLYLSGHGLELFKGGSPKLMDPRQIPAEDRAKIKLTLDSMFGTPREPRVKVLPKEENEELNQRLRAELKLDPETLARGNRLYRVHCLHCHGATGDGAGPAGRWLNPHPRDYRQGLFKFQSVDQTQVYPRSPLRSDLYRSIEQGLSGTSMPEFRLLPPEDLDALVSYVIHLSIRGETEFAAIKSVYRYDSQSNALEATGEQPVTDYLPLIARQIAQKWLDSQQGGIKAGAYPFSADPRGPEEAQFRKSVARGHAIFRADEGKLKELYPESAKDGSLTKLKAAGCIACHKDYGRQAQYKFDVWGTMSRPADLTTGIYRGGRRPIDLYHRVYSGINGSGMLNDLGRNLSSEQIWDVVNFLRVLPSPALREKYGVTLE